MSASTVDPNTSQGHIRTPFELDAAFRALERALQFTASPLRKFLLICDTMQHARHLPEAWLSSYLHGHAAPFARLVQHPDITCLAPEDWSAALVLLQICDRHGWLGAPAERHDTLVAALDKALFSFSCTGEIEQMHGCLVQHGAAIDPTAASLLAPLSADAINRILSVGPDEYDRFTAWRREVRTDACTEVITAVGQRWRRFLDQEHAVPIALIEDEPGGAVMPSVAGRILSLEIHPLESGLEIRIENALDEDGSELMTQLRVAQQVAASFVRERLHSDVLTSHAFRVPHPAAIRGRSLALSSAVGMVCFSSGELNTRIRWTTNPRVLCIGSLTADGVVEESPLPILLNKIRLAFYSPIHRIVVHTQQCSSALAEVQRLMVQHPGRRLEVVGVSTLGDCFDRPGIVGVEFRSPLDRVRRIVQRHALAMMSVSALVLVAVAGYALYAAYYDYPNLEHALGLRIGKSSIVYNPKDSLEWCLRDGAVLQSTSIPFGDLEVGDGFTRDFWIWNLTPRDKPVVLAIEGRDAGEWYINWQGGEQILPARGPLRMSVMFAPLRAARDMRAALAVRDAGTGAALFRLDLTGAAGAPATAGYALHLDGIDDMVTFGRKAAVFESEEGTFECWLRPLDDHAGTVLYNGSNFADEEDIQNLTITRKSSDSLWIQIGNVVNDLPLPPWARIPAGTWTHLSVAYSIPRQRVLVAINGRAVLDAQERLFIAGLHSPHVSIGARFDGQAATNPLHAELDEVRFWQVFRSADQIRSSMHRPQAWRTPGLRASWSFDHDNDAYSLAGVDMAEDGEALHRPALVRADIPGFAGRVSQKSLAGQDFLTLAPTTWLHCVRNPLPRFCDATVALEYRSVASDTNCHFAIINNDRVITFGGEVFGMAREGHPMPPIPDGWHQAVLRMSRQGVWSLFIDGAEVLARRTRREPVDWEYRYEGMLIGFLNDRYNTIGSKYFRLAHPMLVSPRRYRSMAIWARALTDEDIRALARGGEPGGAELRAHWVLRGDPDAEGNYLDRVSGLRMHLKRLPSWQ